MVERSTRLTLCDTGGVGDSRILRMLGTKSKGKIILLVAGVVFAIIALTATVVLSLMKNREDEKKEGTKDKTKSDTSPDTRKTGTDNLPERVEKYGVGLIVGISGIGIGCASVATALAIIVLIKRDTKKIMSEEDKRLESQLRGTSYPIY